MNMRSFFALLQLVYTINSHFGRITNEQIAGRYERARPGIIPRSRKSEDIEKFD